MKHLNITLAILMSAILLTSCKDKADKDFGFSIAGTAMGFADGDKLLLTDSEGTPIDTLVVNEQSFAYEGATDSVQQYMIYEMANDLNSVNFFTENGTINIELNKQPGNGRVGGTVANDAWQELTEATKPYYDKMQQLEDSLYSGNELSQEAQWVLVERYYQLYAEINKKVLESAEKNADNELGYFLMASYHADDESANPQVRNIIAKMPENFRQREPMQRLEEKLKTQEATEIGKKAPDFTLPSPDGSPINIMDEVKKHRVTVLDFWASWCGPCRQEMPTMRQLYEDYKDKGLGIVGISLDDNSEAWVKAINDLKIEWPQVSDLKGWEAAPAQLFSVSAIPFIVVLDQEGTIINKNVRGEKLQQFIEHCLQ